MVLNKVLNYWKLKNYIYYSDSKTRIFSLLEYIHFISSYYIFGGISIQTSPKSGLIEKKTYRFDVWFIG